MSQLIASPFIDECQSKCKCELNQLAQRNIVRTPSLNPTQSIDLQSYTLDGFRKSEKFAHSAPG